MIKVKKKNCKREFIEQKIFLFCRQYLCNSKSCFLFNNFQNKLINTGPRPWRLLIFSLIWMLVEWYLYKFFSVEFVTDAFYNANAKDLCVHYLLGNIEHLMWYKVPYHRQCKIFSNDSNFPRFHQSPRNTMNGLKNNFNQT